MNTRVNHIINGGKINGITHSISESRHRIGIDIFMSDGSDGFHFAIIYDKLNEESKESAIEDCAKILQSIVNFANNDSMFQITMKYNELNACWGLVNITQADFKSFLEAYYCE